MELLPAFQGSAEDVARRFATALGRELGAYGPPPGIVAQGMTGDAWRLGEGYVDVWETNGKAGHGQIVFYDPDWPGPDLEDAAQRIRDVLLHFGAVGDDVTISETGYRRLAWTQPTPVGPLQGGRSERTSEWTRSYFQPHYSVPEDAAIDAEKAASLAATFDACRTEHKDALTVEVPKASIADNRLAYLVVLRYGEGTPGGDSYHGCPPARTWVHVDAQTGAILSWDDTYICM